MGKIASSRTKSSNGIMDWFNARLPVTQFYKDHLSEYYAPKNFNFWYFFGSLALLVLVNQIVTGIWLTMHYKPDAAQAFGMVEYIMRDVPWGWLIRYLHTTGASAFFVVIYLHMFRGLLYGSYKKPRELIWVFGMIIYLALMAEAFMGYVLPWGNMSYWGAKVITQLFAAVPWVGDSLVEWVRGDYLISDATLNRFFALHVIALPLVIVVLVVLHIAALHTVGSNNPEGIDIKKHKDENGVPKDGIPFHPYYTVKDIFGVGMFLLIFLFIVFVKPDMGGLFLEHDNYVPADPSSTPDHIKPVWYFTPFYAMLRAVPSMQIGALIMALAIVVLFFLPWLDRSPVKSIRYRRWPYKLMLSLFALAFVVLGWLGMQAGSELQKLTAQILTGFYFFYFVWLFFYSRNETYHEVPERIEK
ncbi:cytochrome bc complex cytochrome b subunit [Marinicella sp. S6413]|uniref:cytochrome b n=1 Tax=Marinicella gelatinilytica TaxID=2996017 RepID=UPI002260FAA7|nr:cytochrome bc complex cytochrome b subunit [Marinicella gelatinilytica]MCX7545308.1 cytochrome bc complex cytochrome b subunit [Marinicella gelatinilytica]